MNKEDRQIRRFRTSCCGAKGVRIARATYRCQKCLKDVSVEYVLFVEAVLPK